MLVYDDTCAFCAMSARWLARHARPDLRLVPMSALPLPGMLEGAGPHLRESAHYITPDGREYHGSESITHSLRLVRGGALFAVLDLPVMRSFRRLAYSVIARNRHHLSRLLGLRCNCGR
jgi:predicted DCC family thiol-disulfide oxidoreductase YuxK